MVNLEIDKNYFNVAKEAKLFAEKAQKANNKEAIYCLWKNEYNRLKNEFNFEINTIKTYAASYYKKEIIRAFEFKHSVKPFDLIDRLATTKSRKEKQFIWLYNSIKLPRKEHLANKNKYTSKLNSRLEKVRMLSDVITMIDLSIKNLNSDNYLELTLALCFLTGRRPIEILKLAKFKAVSKYQLEFEGKAKAKSNKDAKLKFIIPCLADSKLIVKGLTKLRELKDFTSYSEIKAHDSFAKPLGEKVRKIYNFNINCDCLKCKKRKAYRKVLDNTKIKLPKPVKTTGATHKALSETKKNQLMAKNIKFTEKEKQAVCHRLKPYSLRSIYAKICFNVFYNISNDFGIDPVKAIAKILLHGETDISSGNAYKDFMIKESELKRLKNRFKNQ